MQQHKGISRQLADRLTDGGVSALARLLGVTLQAVQTQNRTGKSGPVLHLLLEVCDVLDWMHGAGSAREIIRRAAERLGREI